MTKTSKLSRLFKFFWLNDTRANRLFLKEWDELLKLLIKQGNVTEINDYVVTFDNKYGVWISNHPVASGHLYTLDGEYCATHYCCSKGTRILLEDFINSLPKRDKIITIIEEDIQNLKENKDFP